MKHPFHSCPDFSLITYGIIFSISGYCIFGTEVCFGKISYNKYPNNGISSATNFDKFISLKDLISNISSLSIKLIPVPAYSYIS